MTVRSVADGHLVSLAAVDPVAAALTGAETPPLADLSPDAVYGRVDLARSTLALLQRVDPVDVGERRLAAVMTERLEAEVDLHESGFTPALVAPLATPVHSIRTRIESLPRATEAEWQTLVEVVEAVPDALAGHRATLRRARAERHVAPRRQLRVEADQIRSWVGDGPAAVVTALTEADAPAHFGSRLTRAVGRAAEGFLETARFLLEELAPMAPVSDRRGDDLYQVTSRAFMGAEVDPAAAADWANEEVERLRTEAAAIAREIDPASDLSAVCRRLDQVRLEGAPQVEAWLERRITRAVDAVTEAGWSVTGMGAVRAAVTPAAAGVMYYTPASPDGAEEATVWWTVGRSGAAPWRQATTVHHEAVPGHHLQHRVAAEADLHPWQRHLCHVHGYAEGWAHHAETLALDLGLVDGPEERLGLVLGRLHRACRIVADTALHLDPTPDHPQRWEADEAVAYLRDVALLDEDTARFEVDRFLGWPGQALAFSLGARLWSGLRAEAEHRAPSSTDARVYRSILDLGPMGLGTLSDLAREVA